MDRLCLIGQDKAPKIVWAQGSQYWTRQSTEYYVVPYSVDSACPAIPDWNVYKLIEQEECLQTPTVLAWKGKIKCTGWIIIVGIIIHLFYV